MSPRKGNKSLTKTPRLPNKDMPRQPGGKGKIPNKGLPKAPRRPQSR